MDVVGTIVALVMACGALVLVGRRLPPGRRLVGLALGLSLCVLVLVLERTGAWPSRWR